MTISTELRRLWGQAVHKGQRSVLQPALVGIVETGGGKRITDAKRPGWVHVRLGPDGQQGQTTAHNPQGIPLSYGAPVLLWEIEGVLSIYGPDPAQWAAFGGETGVAAVGFHNHRRGSKLEYLLEMLLLEAGHVQWSGSGFNVDIRPLWYPYGGVWKYYPGETLDLASYVTATTDNWNWVKIGIDPEINAAVAVAGSAVAGVHLLTLADLAAIAFADYIPLAGYRVTEADADLRGTADRMVDIGFWRGREFVYPEGASGGQVVYGGTDSGDDLALHSTSNATKGEIHIEPAAGIDGPFVAVGAGSLPTDVNFYLFGINGAWMQLRSTTGRAQFQLWADGDNFARYIMEQEGVERWEVGMAEDSSGNLIIGGTNLSPAYVSIDAGGNVRIRHVIGGASNGGHYFGSAKDVDGTAQVIVADGTGDVGAMLKYDVVVNPSTGAAVNDAGTITPGNSAAVYNVGSDILTLAVAANGEISLQRTGGTLTYGVVLTLMWL